MLFGFTAKYGVVQVWEDLQSTKVHLEEARIDGWYDRLDGFFLAILFSKWYTVVWYRTGGASKQDEHCCNTFHKWWWYYVSTILIQAQKEEKIYWPPEWKQGGLPEGENIQHYFSWLMASTFISMSQHTPSITKNKNEDAFTQVQDDRPQLWNQHPLVG